MAVPVVSWVITSPVGAVARPSPGAVAASTMRRTRFGCRRASDWAIIPPIDQPSTSALGSRSARISDATSSPMRPIVSVPGPSVVRRMPSLSKMITRRRAASASTKPGGQASIVPESPMTRTSGLPCPTER